jgi:hypothetical protein
MLTEQSAMSGKDSLDAFGRENLGKRQSRASQKCIDNFSKPAAASMGNAVTDFEAGKTGVSRFRRM